MQAFCGAPDKQTVVWPRNCLRTNSSGPRTGLGRSALRSWWNRLRRRYQKVGEPFRRGRPALLWRACRNGVDRGEPDRLGAPRKITKEENSGRNPWRRRLALHAIRRPFHIRRVGTKPPGSHTATTRPDLFGIETGFVPSPQLHSLDDGVQCSAGAHRRGAFRVFREVVAPNVNRLTLCRQQFTGNVALVLGQFRGYRSEACF